MTQLSSQLSSTMELIFFSAFLIVWELSHEVDKAACHSGGNVEIAFLKENDADGPCTCHVCRQCCVKEEERRGGKEAAVSSLGWLQGETFRELASQVGTEEGREEQVQLNVVGS